MKIEHIAIWTDKIEEMKNFYTEFFKAKSNDKYVNPNKNFESYFLTFESGARLELMKNNLIEEHDKSRIVSGYAHVAFSMGSKNKVDEYAKRLIDSGYKITNGPRTTGDGYYECCFKDPDGNLVEITE